MRSSRLSDPRTWFCVRRNGAARREGWLDGDSPADIRPRVGARPGEVVEACIAGDSRRVPVRRFSRAFFPRARGIVGMELELCGEVVRLSPTRMLAANLGFDRALEKFLEACNASRDEFAAGGDLRAFSAE